MRSNRRGYGNGRRSAAAARNNLVVLFLIAVLDGRSAPIPTHYTHSGPLLQLAAWLRKRAKPKRLTINSNTAAVISRTAVR